MHPALHDISKLIFDTLFPIYCLACRNESDNYFCHVCINKLTRLIPQYCIVCRLPSIEGLTHPKCISAHKPQRLVSIFDYHDKQISQALITGKYRFVPQIFNQLSLFCASTLEQEFYFLKKVNFIVPIPLATKRKRWRGFNQAEIFATILSRRWDIEMAFFLQRIKNTATQKDLDQVKRIRNMNQAFTAIDQSRFKNKSILLVDDVITTGATLLEATKMLKRAGASVVYCATIAQD